MKKTDGTRIRRETIEECARSYVWLRRPSLN